MTIDNMITTLKRDVIRAYAVLDSWFDKDESFYHYEPPGENDKAIDIIEKIVSGNNYLLSLINNGCKEALRKAKLEGESSMADHSEISTISIEDESVHEFFNRLHHVINNSGERNSLGDLREELRDQLYRCLCQLDLLRQGEGFLYSADFSEAFAHKFDVYQLIQLLSLNIWKQITQLKRVESVYAK